MGADRVIPGVPAADHSGVPVAVTPGCHQSPSLTVTITGGRPSGYLVSLPNQSVAGGPVDDQSSALSVLVRIARLVLFVAVRILALAEVPCRSPVQLAPERSAT